MFNDTNLLSDNPLRFRKNLFKQTYNKIITFDDERISEIYNISKEIDFDTSTYHFKGSNTAPINFIDFRGPMHIYNEMKNSHISIEKIEEDQKQFKSKLNEKTTGNPNHKSKLKILNQKSF